MPMNDLANAVEAADVRRRRSDKPALSNWPYTTALIAIPAFAILGVMLLLFLRPEADNAPLAAQIFGFGATITMATLAYLKSSETHTIVNSRMDEFKREIQVAAESAVARARAEGHQDGMLEGARQADRRTDTLARGQESSPG